MRRVRAEFGNNSPSLERIIERDYDPGREPSCRALLRSISPPDKPKLIIVITAYMDESGTHGGAPLLTVAACATGGDHWLRFSRAWEKRLEDANVRCFHASQRSQRGLKRQMIKEVAQQPIFACITSINPGVFGENAGALYRKGMGSAYATCAYWNAVKINQWAEGLGCEDVAYVIEDGQPHVDKVWQVLRMTMKPQAEFSTAAVSIARKRSFIPLQLADFLAHSKSTENEWLAKLRDAIGETGQFEDEVITAEGIKAATKSVESAWAEAGISPEEIGWL